MRVYLRPRHRPPRPFRLGARGAEAGPLPRGRTHVSSRSGGKLLGVDEVLRDIERVLAPAGRLEEVLA